MHPHTFSVTNDHSQPQASLSLSTISFHDLPWSQTTIPYSSTSVYWLFPVQSSQSIDYSQFKPVRGHIRPFPNTNKASSVYWIFPSTTKHLSLWLFPVQTRSVTYDHSLHKPDTSLARSSSFLLPRMSAAVDSWHDEWNIYKTEINGIEWSYLASPQSSDLSPTKLLLAGG